MRPCHWTVFDPPEEARGGSGRRSEMSAYGCEAGNTPHDTYRVAFRAEPPWRVIAAEMAEDGVKGGWAARERADRQPPWRFDELERVCRGPGGGEQLRRKKAPRRPADPPSRLPASWRPEAGRGHYRPCTLSGPTVLDGPSPLPNGLPVE